MNNFVYYNPTRILFGKGSIAEARTTAFGSVVIAAGMGEIASQMSKNR